MAEAKEQNEEQNATDETAEAAEVAAAEETTEPVEAIEAEATEEAPTETETAATAEAPLAAPIASPEPAAPSAPAKPVAEYQPPDELSRPAVLDINAILTPISPEAPSGEYLRYEGIYDEISEERRADEDLALGAWQTELKVANFKKVIELAAAALTQKTKDLQLAAWLSEAVVAEHGFAGLRDSLKIMSGLISNFWDSVYPEAEEGDEEGRANAIAWFDEKAGFLIQKAPIIDNVDGGYFGYLDSK
ncbi:MAG: type VI secretion system ImpA family N-terminal domain-containing protein, partial [Acidobacteriota bacterium]|nr:type VI secretion system ImpA family N-terminal domain-containing protein [Acidobacteriota bacterium]